MTEPSAKDVQEALAAFFDPKDVKFKPQMVKQNRALAMAYIDARLVMDRLDAAVGVGGWRTEYRELSGHSVECRLSLLIGGQWVTKADVGSPSEQPDEGDRMKAAYSDALKRAAVQFGIGRYLYRLPAQWRDYDPAKKQFAKPPAVPAWAVPVKCRPEVAAERGKRIEALIRTVCERSRIDAEKTIADTLAAHKVAAFADLPAADADQLLQRLNAKIAELAKQPAPAEKPAAK